MPLKKCNANNCITPHSKTPTRGKRRKVTFGRSLDLELPSPDVTITKRQRPKFTPNSPPHAVIRSPRRTGNEATCIFLVLSMRVYIVAFFVPIVKAMNMP
jgi:hypothetical protein